MARYTGPTCRLCRREDAQLYLKGDRCFSQKCGYERRPYPPGQHGQGHYQPAHVAPLVARAPCPAALCPERPEAPRA